MTAPRHWIPFRNKVMKSRNDKLKDVYSDLLGESDDNLSGIMVLLVRMITVKASAAACECGFSCMNRQKINIRTSLASTIAWCALRICTDDGGLKRFDAEKNSKCWMDITNGVRHFKGTKSHLKNERPTMVKLSSFRVTSEQFILLVLKFLKYYFFSLTCYNSF